MDAMGRSIPIGKCPQGPSPVAVSESRARRGHIRREPPNGGEAYRSLRWRARHVPLPLPQHRAGGAGNGGGPKV